MKVKCTASWKGMACAIEGQVRRTCGTFPNISTVRIPSTTFDPWDFEDEEASKGDLVLTTVAFGVSYDLTIADLYAHDIEWHEEYIGAKASGEFVATVTLKDRRFLWNYGHASGSYNVPTEDGKGVVEGTARTLAELIGYCLVALGDTPPDDIPEGGDDDPPDGPHVEWALEDARSELERLLAYAGYVLALDSWAEVKVYRAGQGEVPDFPGSFYIPRSVTTVPTYGPEYVIVTTAPRRIRDERTIASWEAVGEEADGTIKPINQLSYKPSEGWYEAAAHAFPVMDKPDQTRAMKCVFKWYRIPGAEEDPPTHRDKLPLLEDRSTVVDGVRAKLRITAAYSYFDKETGTHLNGTGDPRINYSVDFKRGIVKFARICAPIANPGVRQLEETRYQSPSVSVTFGYEVRDFREEPEYDPERREYYRYVQGEGRRERVVKLPGGTLYRINGVDQNKTQLDAVAKKIADRILAEPVSVEKGPHRVFGHWRVECDGVIREVVWTDAFTTEYAINEERPSAAGYLQKRSMKRALTEAEMARASTTAEPDSTGIGAGLRAHQDPGEGSFEVAMPAPAGFVKYGA